MALSRLSNLGANPSGVVLYVDPSNFDSTDSIENRGISPLRPFSSIQRSLLEAALYSFQPGRNNDRNDRTTIVVSPGTHYIDNRPGFSIQDIANSAIFKKRTGKDTWSTVNLQPFGDTTNFDIFDPNNDLYKYNSVNGGIILPRGTSIIGQDLRKTKIRPLYVPDPLDPDVELSSIFNVTGSCYFSQFTFFDADNTKFSYKNYTDSKHTPKYSHNKLTSFVYADGVNKVRLGTEQTNLTDLEMYYYKITRAYDSLSGRGISDFPANQDFEPNINEFRIVGPLQENPLGISSIRAGNGDGTGDNSIITVTTADIQSKVEKPHNFAVDTPIIIRGITESPNSYNGSFTVRQVVGINTFTFVTTTLPSEVLPVPSTFDFASVSVETDTVSSASPYIFNCSIRSVYGMNGMWADGARADGFKSMVVAQFTGVSLQKDNDAYIIYDNGVYYDNITLPAGSRLRPLYQNSRSIFKPEFESYHIRASNDAFIQAVSVFAIGYAKHFLTESGADMSITNSNSNFGANALNSVGFRKNSFNRDDTGYITHIIPPRELMSDENDISWLSLDVEKTNTVANPKKLFLFGFSNKDIKPSIQVDGYRVGARIDDKIYLTLALNNQAQETYNSPIYMTTPDESTGIIQKKEYQITRVGTVNSISSNVITLTGSHKLFSGESVRLFSNTGQAPEGLDIDKIYYAITTTVDGALSSNQIKLATSLNDALNNTFITSLGNNGGIIKIVSSVTDKNAGDLGHPVQYDVVNNNWYVFTDASTTINQIYTVITGPESTSLGTSTPSTYIKRRPENRSIEERLYKFRYVIPKEYIDAKPPQTGYILQESKNVAISTISINESVALLNSTQLRNDKVIVSASAASIVNGTQIVTIDTEYPHNLLSGDIVNIQNIRSTNNPTGVGIVSTYNGEFDVLTTPSSRRFTYRLSELKVNPGSFTNNINQRSTQQQRDIIPVVSRQSYKNKFYIYKIDTIKEHRPGNNGQDGIYHLTILSSNVGIGNNVGYGLSNKYFNQDIRNLYPQVDRDNPQSNPNPSVSYADLRVIGNVITDDKKKSLTFEAVSDYTKNTRVGFGITNISISGSGNTTITIFTDIEHKLNSIRSVTVNSTGSGYSTNTTVYSALLIDTKFNEEDATCRYTTSPSGTLNSSSLRLNDVGSAHTVGEQLGVQGGLSNAIIQVSAINNNIGDGLELTGFNSTDLNGIFEIVSVPNKKSVTIFVPSGISSYVANTNNSLPVGYIASKGVNISSMILSDITSGIATITSTYPHGLLEANKFKFTNSNVSFYNNKDFIVNKVINPTSFNFNVGIATTTNTPTVGKIFKYINNSNAITIGRGEENLASRATHFYSGLSVTLASPLTINSTTMTVDNASGINRGDYLTIKNEVFRVSTNPSGNTFNVLRAQLGTIKVSADNGEVVRKIKIIPTELRRPSFMRASGHTFEYLGYGPGNYSTALPQRQDRILSSVEVLTSQAKKEQGGNIVYTGMNDLGEFYTGSTKVSATTGEQTVIGAPIITFTGDDVNGENENKQSGIFDELIIRDRITVEGGENNNESSQFYGPVKFEKRLTNLSPEGVLLRNLFVKGTSSQEKLITVGISTPTLSIIPSPKPGHISLISDPKENYVGQIYKNGEWRQFGLISNEANNLSFTVNKLGIGVSPTSIYSLNVVGSTQLENLNVTGSVSFTQAINLGNVNFEDVTLYGTARFTGGNIQLGITTSYTQIHESGISKLNDLEVVGISSFYNDVYINKPNISGVAPGLFADRLDLRNIRVGIAASNVIDNKSQNLIIRSITGNTLLDNNIIVNGIVSITTTRASGIATATITDSRQLKLGIGNTNQNSSIDLINDSRVHPDFGLRITRNSGIGSQSSSITHRGNQSLIINAFDIGADVRFLTNNTDRLIISSSGMVTYTQNNSGQNLLGAHLRINQRGVGDATLSWDCPDLSGNPTYRWYAGIDTSDGYSWKLANPVTTTPYGNDNFDTDTKLKVDSSGNLILATSSGIATFNGSNIISSVTGTFNLLNTNVTTVNAFGRAESVNIARNSNSSRVNIIGTSQSTDINNGSLVVSGGVGIDKNLNVGGIIDSKTYIQSTTPNDGTTTGGARIRANGSGISRLQFISNNGVDELLNVSVASGTATFSGLIDSITPNTGTTGGARIRANGSGSSRLQFVSNNGVNELLNISVASGTATFSGNITASGLIDSITPNDGTTTGGVRIRANGSGISRLQFVNSNSTSELLNIAVNSGTATFSGLIDSITPNDGTTGGVRIRANSVTGISRLQFVNSNSTSELLNIAVNSGNATFSGNINSSGTITANTFSGNGTIPVGGIIMWSGTTAPTGWALCNGLNGTPDLRDRFIVGATSGGDNVYPGVVVGQTGGNANAVLISHSHGSSAPQGGFALANIGTQTNEQTITPVVSPQSQGVISPSTANAGSGDGTNANLPPYFALAFIMRIS